MIRLVRVRSISRPEAACHRIHPPQQGAEEGYAPAQHVPVQGVLVFGDVGAGQLVPEVSHAGIRSFAVKESQDEVPAV